MRKDLKEKLEKIEELEKALNTVKNQLEVHYSKLILELEKSNQTKFSHIEQRVDFLLSNNPCSKELEYLKELVLTNLKEYSNIILQLREQMIKQNSIINLAAKNAVDSALQGEIRALVVSEIKTMVSDTGKTMLYDESKNSILGVSKDVTEDVISVLQDKISSLIVEEAIPHKSKKEIMNDVENFKNIQEKVLQKKIEKKKEIDELYQESLDLYTKCFFL